MLRSTKFWAVLSGIIALVYFGAGAWMVNDQNVARILKGTPSIVLLALGFGIWAMAIGTIVRDMIAPEHAKRD